MFFSFDGVDGVGKSTQVTQFVGWLQQQGYDVVTCRDPGSTPLGEKLRSLVLGDATTPIHRRAEMLLYMAARAQLVEEVIRPALAAGRVVVSDRFVLANVVYQGHAGGLDVKSVWQVGRVATDGIGPDRVFLLDMPAAEAMQRISRAHDRMESQGVEFLERVRQGFLREAARFPETVQIVNAARDPDVIQTEIRRSAERLLRPS